MYDVFRQLGEEAAKLSSASESVLGLIRGITNRALDGLVEAPRNHQKQSTRSANDNSLIEVEVSHVGRPYDNDDNDDNDDGDWQVVSVSEKIDAQIAAKPTIPLEDDWIVCSLDKDGSVSVINLQEPPTQRPGAAPHPIPSPATSADLWRSIQVDLCQANPPMHTAAKLTAYICLRDKETRLAEQKF
ncbi:uncharacterized protein A1O5_07955 [Cladophialophora psammophila CBS 110553]|uniref:Uncharacterized protein n=1 Tax=Cladophialophora psammophila CBS 110553 TaxID=1182543 RepID=W9WVE2_9EURO|nr:uncharacterized protein A1O5_07955 [Cladophialophora psammophila CBS 110553]EXJ69020.1 hypothetical protein A1O5_07955 [Cladophialophora psammophila CBS 110553]